MSPNHNDRPARDDRAMAEMVASVASSIKVDAIICVTETGSFLDLLLHAAPDLPIIAATPSQDTLKDLSSSGLQVIQLPIRVTSKFREAQHAVSMALSTGKINIGDLLVCAVGRRVSRHGGVLLFVMEVEDSAAEVSIHELVKLHHKIQPQVLEAALEVARYVGRAARRGKRVGCLITLGDEDDVLRSAKQLVLNPFHGHPEDARMLTQPTMPEMILELSKLDGAFVVRGDGCILTAGAYLTPTIQSVEVAQGLGARHMTAAAVSAQTTATVVAVSSTDGNIRVYSDGELVLRMDPELVPESGQGEGQR